MPFLIRLLVNAAALWVATRLVPGVSFTGGWLPFLGVALVFGVLNAFIRPADQAPHLPADPADPRPVLVRRERA